jgi:hypothetical protein
MYLTNSKFRNHKSRDPTRNYKRWLFPEAYQSSFGIKTVHIDDFCESQKSQDSAKTNSVEITETKGQGCDDCGQLFCTVHNVQRHVKTNGVSITGI